MKRLERNNWNDIKNLITEDVKLEDGTSLRIIKNTESGLIEIVVDHKTLSGLNQDDNFQPVILVEGFKQD